MGAGEMDSQRPQLLGDCVKKAFHSTGQEEEQVK